MEKRTVEEILLKHGATRIHLSRMTGMSDRYVRGEIERLRRIYPIYADESTVDYFGKQTYRIARNDFEAEDLARYDRQEDSRAIKILQGGIQRKKFLASVGQLSFEDIDEIQEMLDAVRGEY